MGMYDNIAFACKCPKCGELVNSFQSKDGPRTFKTLKPEQVHSWYDECDNCHEWIEFTWHRNFAGCRDFKTGPIRVIGAPEENKHTKETSTMQTKNDWRIKRNELYLKQQAVIFAIENARLAADHAKSRI